MTNPWFKFYGSEYLSDPKIASLSVQEKSCWITLLCLSSISSIPGTVEFLTIEVLLTKAGIVFDPYNPEEWNNCLSVLDKLAQMHMIAKSKEGVITITNWSKRQESALTAAERQAKYRENRRSNEKVTERVTKVTLEEKRREEKREDNTLSSAKTQKEESYPELFDEFWKGYPKKTGKGAALASWKKLRASQELHQRIMESVRAHKESKDWKKENGRFIPLPTTFLNQKRFDDDTISTTSSKYSDYA